MPKKKTPKEIKVHEGMENAFVEAKVEETKPEEEPKTDEELTEQIKEKGEAPLLLEEKLPKGMVKVKVRVGTLQFEDGIFKKGDIFITQKKRLKQFDPNDIEIT